MPRIPVELAIWCSPSDDVDLQNGESVTVGTRSNFVRRKPNSTSSVWAIVSLRKNRPRFFPPCPKDSKKAAEFSAENSAAMNYTICWAFDVDLEEGGIK